MLRYLLEIAKRTPAEDWFGCVFMFASFLVAYCFFT